MAQQTRGTVGRCAICGREGALTFEHVPPKSAFNETGVLLQTLDQIMREETPRRTKGVGRFSLCGRCNNRTGSVYGTEFVAWCKEAVRFWDALERVRSESKVTFSAFTYPLRVGKQILVMFATVNGPGWFERNPALRKLVQDKETRGLPDSYHCYLYLASGPRSFRWTGFVSSGDLHNNSFSTFSEFCYPPFGYVICAESEPPHESMRNIDDLFRYGFGERAEVSLELPILPVESYLPGDYRTAEQIDDHLRRQGIDPTTYDGWERY